jgi:hypothetical protein
LTFTDIDGHRFQVFITDQADHDIAYLEARHRGHARVENNIRNGKESGMRNLPFHAFSANAVWLELVLMGQDLMSWFRHLCLDGAAARWEPKRIRNRLLHTAARLVRTGRQVILRLPPTWRWADILRRAFDRVRALRLLT